MPYGFPVVGEQGNVFPIQFLFDGPFGGGGFDLTAFVNTGSDGAHWVPELSDLFTDDGTTAAGDTDSVKQINDLSTFGRNLTTKDNTTRGTYDAPNRRIGLDGTDDFYFHDAGVSWPGGPYLAWVSFTTLDPIVTNLRALAALLDGGEFNDNAFIVDGNNDGTLRIVSDGVFGGNDFGPVSPGNTVNVVLAHDGTDLNAYVNGSFLESLRKDQTFDPVSLFTGAQDSAGTRADENSRLQLYNAGYRIGSWTTDQRDDVIAHLTAQGYGS